MSRVSQIDVCHSYVLVRSDFHAAFEYQIPLCRCFLLSGSKKRFVDHLC